MDFYHGMLFSCDLHAPCFSTDLHSIGAVFDNDDDRCQQTTTMARYAYAPLSVVRSPFAFFPYFDIPFPPPLSMTYYFSRPRSYYNRRKDEDPAADVASPTRRPPRPNGPRRSTSACRCSWECVSSSP